MSMKTESRAPGQCPSEGWHPPVTSIEDVITFRLQRVAAIGERAGQDWALRAFGLSLNEWRVLALVKARMPVRASDVADVLLMDKSQMSRLIKGMAGRKFLRNTPDALDARATTLTLTPRGRALHDNMMGEVMRSNAQLVSGLSPTQVQALHTMLAQLIDNALDLLAARSDA